MRSPERVLNSLSEHSKVSSYKFERLYRNLFNQEMFYVAYERIYAKEGNMTKGSDGRTIDNMSLSRIEKLISSLKDESYQPHPSRRVYIPKKNGKTRPLGIPAFEDKLVQEVLRMILEAIYERYFEYTSHGFRPIAVVIPHSPKFKSHFAERNGLSRATSKDSLTTSIMMF